MQKIKFIPHFFFEKLLRYCKPVILVTLGMTGHAHQNQKYQLVENFDVSLYTKVNLMSLFLFEILRLKESCNLID